MDEETQKQATPEESGEGDIPEPNDKIDRANAAAQRMEEATEKLKEENNRAEALQVERTLGGTAEAGKEAEKPKEETAAEYSKKVMENAI